VQKQDAAIHFQCKLETLATEEKALYQTYENDSKWAVERGGRNYQYEHHICSSWQRAPDTKNSQ